MAQRCIFQCCSHPSRRQHCRASVHGVSPNEMFLVFFQILFHFFQVLFYCFNLFEELSNYLLCFPCFSHWLWTARDLCTHLQVSNQSSFQQTLLNNISPDTYKLLDSHSALYFGESNEFHSFFYLSCLHLGHPLWHACIVWDSGRRV